jgi:hypothetical protein
MILPAQSTILGQFYFALSALSKLGTLTLPGRCPGLLHFAPLALAGSFPTSAVARMQEIRAGFQ